MATREINGKTIEFDEDGYMKDGALWDEGIAEALAKEVDIDELTDDHWKVIKFLRKEYEESNTVPALRKIGKRSGVDMKSLYRLFSDGPVKKAAYIAGLPKPRSCV